MNKMDVHIMCVARDELLGEDHFEGFSDSVDFSKKILENYEYKRRGDLEEDENYKQPVVYIFLIDEAGKVFVYQRAKDKKDYAETRLQGNWSCGVGGHIDKEDEEREDPLFTGMLRELHEEVHVEVIGEPELLGYINGESTPVERVHFGVLYVVKTTGEVIPNDGEIAHGQFMTFEELKELCENPSVEVENWTKIGLEPLKDYLNALS